ncbi:MAG: hypothetical protein IIW14_00585, partial [Kiritimatiellae bacterium]|nr:hypothetical protein [Kiritimatiellia bacterium]
DEKEMINTILHGINTKSVRITFHAKSRMKEKDISFRDLFGGRADPRKHRVSPCIHRQKAAPVPLFRILYHFLPVFQKTDVLYGKIAQYEVLRR